MPELFQCTQFIEENVNKIATLPREIGFIARLGLLSGLREQELIYIKEREVCNNGYGCDCEKLHLVNCKSGMTIIAIGSTRGNKKALSTILISCKSLHCFFHLQRYVGHIQITSRINRITK
jgi:hypothetical protein